MSGTSIWNAAMAQVVAQLVSQVTGVVVEADRRAPVTPEECPRLVVQMGEISEDLGMSPGEAFHAISITVSGFATGASDTACREALAQLMARCVVALNGIAGGGIYDVVAGPRRMQLFPLDESARAFGAFEHDFIVSAVTAAGNPYAP